MIDLGLAVNGVAIGMAVAAPIGPVNLIVIRRTLRYGALNGFLSGGGAAAGDALFAVVLPPSASPRRSSSSSASKPCCRSSAVSSCSASACTWFSKPHTA